MKFVSLYKGITLIVQRKCAKRTRVYKTPNRFCTTFKQLKFDIKTIIDNFFFLFLPNYVIKTFRTKINTGNKIKINHVWIVYYK